MNYKLAKQLKDAGFPQWSEGQTTTLFMGDPIRYSNRDKRGIIGVEYEDVRVPTADELIDAVKKHPMNRKDIGIYSNNGKYVAWARKTRLDFGGDGDRDVVGDTPSEALAKLWLELNTK